MKCERFCPSDYSAEEMFYFYVNVLCAYSTPEYNERTGRERERGEREERETEI